MARFKLGDLIEVFFLDSYRSGGWMTLSEALKVGDELKCVASGYFLRETEQAIHLATTILLVDHDPEITDVMSIPKIAFTKRPRLVDSSRRINGSRTEGSS